MKFDRDQIHFRFFKHIEPAARLAVFKAFGLITDEVTDTHMNHGIERKLLDAILRAGPPAPSTASDAAAPKAHIIREVVNEVRDIAIKFHAHQSLRDRINHAMSPLIDYCKGVPDATPAAPVVAEELKLTGETLAWALVLPNGNIRLWSKNRSTVEKMLPLSPEGTLTPILAAHPVAGSPVTAEEMEVKVAAFEAWCANLATAAPVPASEAAKQTLPQSECNAALRAAPAGRRDANSGGTGE